MRSRILSIYKALAVEVNHSDLICLAMDQLLGHDTGRVFNDEAAVVASGAKSPDGGEGYRKSDLTSQASSRAG
jgi:hypothetical protein